MSKINCPFCNSRNTFYIAYGYLGKKKQKKDYIDQKDIGINIKYKKGYEKVDFDGEKLISRLPNRYCQSCGKTFHSRKVMYTVDIAKINLIIYINKNYYRYIFDFSDKTKPKYTLKVNWIPKIVDKPIKINEMNKILTSLKLYKPNKWHGHYGKDKEYTNYYWILKCVYNNGLNYVKSGYDKVPENWNKFIKPFKEIFKENIFDLKS